MSLLPKMEIIGDDSSSPLKLSLVVISGSSGGWSGRSKLLVALLAVALYVYVLLFFKTLYLREYRIERITNTMQKTAEMMEHLYARDQKLAANILLLRTTHSDQ